MSDSAAPAPLDPERLAEICDGDREFEKELVDEFLESAPPLIYQVKEALAQLDIDSLRRAAHTLKGASSSVGASMVYQVSLALEMSARENRMEDARALYDQLHQAFEDLRAYVPGYFNDLAA